MTPHRLKLQGLLALTVAAVLCTLSASASAQQQRGAPVNFKPTMADVDPGVDHGNSDDDLPQDYQRQAVFYRSQQPPGTIIIDTQERHLYLIESETRAMYLGNTVYRIHGTNAPETIGQAVSSGCFRLVNDDVIDLYDRVPVGTHVIVRQD